MRAAIPALLTLAAALPAPRAEARPHDALGHIAVPDTHPRILVTEADLPDVRQRLAADERLAAELAARARGYLREDPADPMARFSSLQSRCHGLAQCLATVSFWGLVDDSARVEVEAWLRKLDVTKIAMQLPESEYMPRGEFLYGFPLAYDWVASWAAEDVLEKLRGIVDTHAKMNFEGINEQKNWEGRTEANNHSMAAMGGVGLAGIARWGEVPAAREWAKVTAHKVWSYLSRSFDGDGACYEGNLYGPFGCGQALPFAAAVRHLKGNDLFGEQRLSEILAWCISDLIPAEQPVMNPLNDASGQRLPGNLSLYAAHAYRDGLAIWALDKSGGGVWAPYRVLWPIDRSYAAEPGDDFKVRWHGGRGLLNVRTGFGADDTFASFEAGHRRKGCHGQGDQGQVTFYAAGGWYAVDPGYSNKKDEDSGNQTPAHNLVLIDGKGQALTGGGKVVEAEMLGHHTDDTWTVAKADLKKAYDTDGWNPVLKALRTFVWVTTPGRPYVVVVDEIVKDAQAHRFESRLHTMRGYAVAWDKNVATITPTTGPKLRVHWLGPKVQGETGDADWGSWLKSHPVLKATGAGRAWFCVQLFELEEDGVTFTPKASGKKLTIERVQGALTDKLTVVPGRGKRPATVELVRTDAGKRVYKKKY